MVLCNPIQNRFKYVSPDREFCSEISQNATFSGKIRNPGNREFLWIFNFLWYRLICNVGVHFLTEFCKNNWFLRKFRHFSFLQIYKDIDIYQDIIVFDQDLRKSQWVPFKKSCKFWSKEARAFKFFHFMPYMMHLKMKNYGGFRKIFSISKIEYAAVGAKLNPPNRVEIS